MNQSERVVNGVRRSAGYAWCSTHVDAGRLGVRHRSPRAMYASAAMMLLGAIAGCQGRSDQLPEVVQSPLGIPELKCPPGPASVAPAEPVVLTAPERAALEELRHRGASITVLHSGDVLVHLPLGALERQWQQDGSATPLCGVSISHSFSPSDSGPPMTDADLVHLEAIRKLARVNLGGTAVTADAVAAFRKAHPAVRVETDSAE